MRGSLAFHEIVDIDDDYLLPWLDLYEQAFPANEKLPVSHHLRALKERAFRAARSCSLLAALDEQGELVGMARYDTLPDGRAVYLIYMAVVEARRGTGIGSRLYHEISRRIRREQPGAEALLFEVEQPDQALTPVGRANAQRRIRFYQRLGARLLRGIDYLQAVPHQPPVPMHLMVHPYHAISPEEAFQLAASVFTLERRDAALRLE